MGFGCCLWSYLSFLSKVGYMLLGPCLILGVLCCLGVLLVPPLARWYSKRKNPHLHVTTNSRSPRVAFFHPYCNAGGGGERVLWVAIKAMQHRYPSLECIVYTGDTDATPDEISQKAKDRFNIELLRPIQFIFLTKRRFVEAKLYPYFTLLGQSLGSLLLGFEALFNFVPDVYIDTMGYAFTVPLFRYLGSSSALSYVHYPTISTDMLTKVSEQITSFNNASFISRSPILTRLKLIYYNAFAYLYGVCGKCNEAVMVNSTWTFDHICSLWNCKNKTSIVYPPCDVDEFMKIPIETKQRAVQTLVSVAQFRPEKNHPLQIRSFAKFLSKVPDNEKSKYKLILVGSCRNTDDADRVIGLENLARELKLADNVEIKLNVSFEELKCLLSNATLGLHTMKDEHFGIGVVECMAAGIVVLAHNSGGPRLDIVIDHHGTRTGYLADSEESYARSMKEIVNLDPHERQAICNNARESVAKFSDRVFQAQFVTLVEPFIKI